MSYEQQAIISKVQETHLKSGLNVCKGWFAHSEQAVQAWVAGLVEIADWTSDIAHMTASLTQLMRYAIIGLVQESAKKA